MKRELAEKQELLVSASYVSFACLVIQDVYIKCVVISGNTGSKLSTVECGCPT